MGLLGGLIGSSGKASEYRQKAAVARAKGKAERQALYAQGTAVEEAGKRNAALERMNMTRLASAGEEAVGKARATAAGSGFDIDSGTGGRMEEETSAAVASKMADAALSSSVSQANALETALGYRRQGDAVLRAAESEAKQYELAAKSVKQGAWFSTALSAVGAVAGAFIGGPEGAIQGANLGWDLGASQNPFLGDTVDGKEFSSGLSGLVGKAQSNKRMTGSYWNNNY